MELLKRTHIATVILTAVILTLVGCSSRYRLNRDLAGTPSPWPYHRGDLQSLGAVTGGEYDGSLNVVWEQESNDKPIGPLTILHNRLVYPGARNKIKFFDLATGRYRGYIKPKGDCQTGVIADDSLAFFAMGPRSNRIKAINMVNGKTLWQRRFLDAAGGAILADGKLIFASSDSLLLALNPYDGAIEWYFDADTRLSVPATASDGKVFQPGDNNILYAVSVKDGSMLYAAELDGPPMSAVAVGEHIYVADMRGKVYALNKNNGQRVWSIRLAGPIWTSPAVANGRLFVGHSGGELVALNAATGDVLWTFDAVDVVRSSAVVAGNFVVFGTMAGKLISLNARDGSPVQERDLGGPLAIDPVTDGNHIFVATEKGIISCFGPPLEQDTIASR